MILKKEEKEREGGENTYIAKNLKILSFYFKTWD
jgi:hypothetical protein